MMRPHRHARIALAALAIFLVAAEARTQEGVAQPQRPFDRTQDLFGQQQQIRRSRIVTRRIERDRRASDEVKQQARELDGVLDKREEILQRLQAKQKQFLAQHKGEIDELQDLSRRARELDDRLSAARKDVLDGSKDDVTALKEASTHAADLADALRVRYQQERRGGRRPQP